MSPGYYREDASRAERVLQLFTKIARRYDLVNDLQSLGLHRAWKKRLVAALDLADGQRVLDLACGSGDLAFQALRAQPTVRVIGGDFTEPMLRVAQARTPREASNPSWVRLDGLGLPFPGSCFHRVMMAYGLRNMADPATALREIARVLRPGGRLGILDFGRPPHPVLRFLFQAALRTIQPVIGWLFFGDAKTYAYIHESLERYPAQEGVRRLLAEAGFARITCQNLVFGAMSLHTAEKPREAA